jgi:DMSO reductase family type II enzyme heme b subunit
MKIVRVTVTAEALLDPDAAAWTSVPAREFQMLPTPLTNNPMIKRISPFIERSSDHGTIKRLTAAGMHNGEVLALRLSWPGAKHDRIVDLDEFVDGVAVMFPLGAKASAITMGAPGQPVNAWYWKADLDGVAFDVVAEGYGTSERRKGEDSDVGAGASYRDGIWRVVLCRSLDAGDGRALFHPGQPIRLAFAVWDGGNRERAGRKSFSGDFVPADLDA